MRMLRCLGSQLAIVANTRVWISVNSACFNGRLVTNDQHVHSEQHFRFGQVCRVWANCRLCFRSDLVANDAALPCIAPAIGQQMLMSHLPTENDTADRIMREGLLGKYITYRSMNEPQTGCEAHNPKVLTAQVWDPAVEVKVSTQLEFWLVSRGLRFIRRGGNRAHWFMY